MWLWIVSAVVAYFVKGLSGFANTLVFTSILGFGANNINISPVDLIIGYPSNLILTIKNRKKFNFKLAIPLAGLVLLGCIPGAFLLKNINAQYIKILFGFLVIGLGIEMLLRDAGKLKIKESKVFTVVIGILSGIFCGLFGVGALLAAYVGRFAKSGDEFKANISAVFFIENTFRMGLYFYMGVFTMEAFKTSLILLPCALVGLFFGIKCSSKLNDKIVMKIVICLLILSGISLVILNL